MKLKLPKLFENKYLLYVALVVASANVLGYLAKEKYNAVTFFLAIGLLSSYFTKNMTVVLLICVLSTALASTQNVIEGMEVDDKKIKVGKEMSEEIKGTESEPLGKGADDIEKETGLPKGITAVFDSSSPGKITLSGTPEEEGTFEYEIKFKVEKGKTAPDSVKGKIVVEATDDKENDNPEIPEKKEPVSDGPSGVCIPKDPNDDDKCSSNLEESACKNKCEWKLAQPAKSAIKASMIAKGDQFCLNKLIDEKDQKNATHKLGDDLFEKVKFSATCAIKCGVNDGDCDDYTAIESGEQFSNMGKRNNVVSNVSRETRVDGIDESEGDRIDYAETTKQAYDNLQQMLGSGGMKGLASETQKLVAQQKELVDSLGQMAPVLNSAKSTLDSLNLPDMKGITNILSTLKGK